MDLQLRSSGVAPGWTLTTALTLTLAAAVTAGPLLAQSGEELFTTACVACHTTTSDRGVGPGLEGVQDRRDREWLLSFITEPDRMIADGDTIATRLLGEYTVPMPNLGTTRAQAESLLDYIATAPAVTVTLATAAQPEASGPPTEDQVLLGQALFQGTTRLANGGPTCNSCHDVTHDAVVGGGTLATELTTVFSRLGGPGVRAILGSPPFPVMQQAYVDKSLTEAEVAGLVAFLEQADAEQALHQPRNYGITLFGAGGAVFIGLGHRLATTLGGSRMRTVAAGAGQDVRNAAITLLVHCPVHDVDAEVRLSTGLGKRPERVEECSLFPRRRGDVPCEVYCVTARHERRSTSTGQRSGE